MPHVVSPKAMFIFSFMQGKQLEKKEVELRALDAFYKEQIAQLEKRVSVTSQIPFLSYMYSLLTYFIFLI